jgi:hypothetical protein
MSENKTPLEIAMTSPALEWQSDRPGRAAYPANFRGRVPLKVKVAKDVRPDMPMPSNAAVICKMDTEYYVWVNSYGAVSAIMDDGSQLGLLPQEFDVTEWHTLQIQNPNHPTVA